MRAASIFSGMLFSALTSVAYAQTPPSRYPPRFPPGAIWNQDVSAATPDSNSSTMITSSVGWGTGNAGNTSFQIDFSMHVLYSSWGNVTNQPLIQSSNYYLPDCDTDSPIPLPQTGAIEGYSDYTCADPTADCHLFIVHGDTLYESFQSTVANGGLNSQCLVKWHLNIVYAANGRGDQCTSADAAGFPMAPLIFNPDEVNAAMQVSNGELGHAIRFILPNGRMRLNSYVHPASHAGAPTGPSNAIPYGARLRLKSAFNISSFVPAAQVILRTLKKYGMFLSDGGNIPLTADDGMFTTTKWADIGMDPANGGSHALFGVSLNDFEVMPIGTPIVLTDNCVRNTFPYDGIVDDVIFADGYNW